MTIYRTFPDDGSRLAFGVAGGTLTSRVATNVTFYSDAARTTLADVRVRNADGSMGSAYAGSVIATGSDSMLPLFFAADVDTLYYLRADGATGAVYARADDRLDALEATAGTTTADLAAHLADTVDAHDASAVSFVPTGTIAATDVQTATAEVATDAAAALTAHVTNTTAAHAASAVAFTPGGTVAATDAQTAIAEVAIDAATALSTHVTNPTAAHAASAVSFAPTGTIAATTAQAAIAEVATDAAAAYVPLTQRAAANGVATLDAGSTVPDAQIPAAVARDAEVAASYVQRLAGTSGTAAKQPFINVKDYGATGNGATDDTAAITAAFAAITHPAGGTVVFPPGTYMAANLVPASDNCSIHMAHGAVLKKNANGPVLRWGLGGYTLLQTRGLTIDGNGAVGYTGGGVLIDGGTFPQMNQTLIFNTNGPPLEFTADSGHSAEVTDAILYPYLNGVGQTNELVPSVQLAADVGAPNRQFVNVQAAGSLLFSDAGSQNSKWVACTSRNLRMTGDPSKLIMSACRVASSGAGITLRAVQSEFDCMWAGPLTFTSLVSSQVRGVIINDAVLTIDAASVRNTVLLQGTNLTVSSLAAATDNFVAYATGAGWTTFAPIRTGLSTTANRPTASVAGQGSQWFDTTFGKPVWSDGSAWRDSVDARVFGPGLYYTFDGPAADSTAVAVLNNVDCARFSVGRTTAFDRITIEITSAAATSVVRLGIYADAIDKPGALVLDAGTVSAATTGVKEVTIAQTLLPGRYWLAAVAQVAACTWRARGSVSNMGQTTGGNVNASGWRDTSGVSGALPSPLPTLDIVQVALPKVMLRAV